MVYWTPQVLRKLQENKNRTEHCTSVPLLFLLSITSSLPVYGICSFTFTRFLPNVQKRSIEQAKYTELAKMLALVLVNKETSIILIYPTM